MKVNGTIINYYIHCKRQCYLCANRLNLEDNSEVVKIGKAIHEELSEKSKYTEIEIDNIKIDRLTSEYITEVKKSDADLEASKWQLLYYLMVLKNKGIIRKGRLECIEKNKSNKKVVYYELNDDLESQINKYINEIEKLVQSDSLPEVINKPTCKKCAYYEYCYI